jgi:hypothetical protein
VAVARVLSRVVFRRPFSDGAERARRGRPSGLCGGWLGSSRSDPAGPSETLFSERAERAYYSRRRGLREGAGGARGVVRRGLSETFSEGAERARWVSVRAPWRVVADTVEVVCPASWEGRGRAPGAVLQDLSEGRGEARRWLPRGLPEPPRRVVLGVSKAWAETPRSGRGGGCRGTDRGVCRSLPGGVIAELAVGVPGAPSCGRRGSRRAPSRAMRRAP